MCASGPGGSVMEASSLIGTVSAAGVHPRREGARRGNNTPAFHAALIAGPSQRAQHGLQGSECNFLLTWRNGSSVAIFGAPVPIFCKVQPEPVFSSPSSLCGESVSVFWLPTLGEFSGYLRRLACEFSISRKFYSLSGTRKIEGLWRFVNSCRSWS